MSFRERARQRTPFPFERVRYLLSRLHGSRLQKDKRLRFVTMNGQRFKRLVLCDSHLAHTIERNLEEFQDTGFFPPLVTRYERELWLEFVDGLRIETVDEELVGRVAEFYATLHARRPRLVEAEESGFPARLRRDLRFLGQVGVLEESARRDLEVAARRLVPESVWVGFDYTDPVLKNFVALRDGSGICAIDVDGLADEQMLGMGAMKACLRWLEPYRERFFAELVRRDAPDLRAYLPFVELSFLARWTKRSFFEHKWKAIDPKRFERFRGDQRTSGS